MLKTSDFGHFYCINSLCWQKEEEGGILCHEYKNLYGIWLYPPIEICPDVLVTVADVQYVLGPLYSYLINLLW